MKIDKIQQHFCHTVNVKLSIQTVDADAVCIHNHNPKPDVVLQKLTNNISCLDQNEIQ